MSIRQQTWDPHYFHFLFCIKLYMMVSYPKKVSGQNIKYRDTPQRFLQCFNIVFTKSGKYR